jgi:hypothetical protein
VIGTPDSTSGPYGYAKGFAQSTGAIAAVAGSTAAFTPIRVPSPPQLDEGDFPPFSFVNLYATVTTTGPIADLTLTGQYEFTPVKNGPGAIFTVAASGLAICAQQVAAPAARFGITVVGAGAAAHVITVSWGAHAAPDFVEWHKALERGA